MNQDGLPLGYIGVAAILVLAPIVVYRIAGEIGLQIASVAISALLTYTLAVLYYHQYSAQSEQTDIMEKQQAVQERQTSIMEQQQTIDEKQTELMERDYESSVFSISQITAKEDYIYLSLNNAGRGTVQQIHLRSEIVSDTGSLDIKPGKSQVITVEGRDSTLPGVSPPKDFKAKVLFTQPRDSGEERRYPFRHFADELAHAGISECTIRLTLEIDDESTRPEDDVIEREIADQEVTTSEVVEREIPAKVGEPDTFKAPLKTQLEDAIKLISPQDILPHNFEERYRSLPQDDETH